MHTGLRPLMIIHLGCSICHQATCFSSKFEQDMKILEVAAVTNAEKRFTMYKIAAKGLGYDRQRQRLPGCVERSIRARFPGIVSI